MTIPLLKEYLNLNIFALVTVRQANKELKQIENELIMLEDK